MSAAGKAKPRSVRRRTIEQVPTNVCPHCGIGEEAPNE